MQPVLASSKPKPRGRSAFNLFAKVSSAVHITAQPALFEPEDESDGSDTAAETTDAAPVQVPVPTPPQSQWNPFDPEAAPLALTLSSSTTHSAAHDFDIELELAADKRAAEEQRHWDEVHAKRQAAQTRQTVPRDTRTITPPNTSSTSSRTSRDQTRRQYLAYFRDVLSRPLASIPFALPAIQDEYACFPSVADPLLDETEVLLAETARTVRHAFGVVWDQNKRVQFDAVSAVQQLRGKPQQETPPKSFSPFMTAEEKKALVRAQLRYQIRSTLSMEPIPIFQ